MTTAMPRFCEFHSSHYGISDHVADSFSIRVSESISNALMFEARLSPKACIDYLDYIGQNRHMKARTANTDTGSGSSVVRRRRAGGDYVAKIRNGRGETLEPSSVTASEAKSEFGRVLEMAIQGGAVVITKHDAPKAVLISVETFNALSGAAETKLDALNHEFDALLAQMQTPKARRGMKTAFAASAKQLGKAAVAAARSRG
jgi:antitoxin Phd